MSLPAQPKLVIRHLTGDFYVFTTYQEYNKALVPSNGMYLVTTDGVVMIDAPWDATQFQPLLDSILRKHSKKVVLSIATHFHSDRTGGFDFLKSKGVKTYSSYRTDEWSKKRNEQRAEFLFSKDTVFTVGNHSFQSFYGGAGHSEDNIVIWFGREKILYGGCLVKSTEATTLGNLGDANLAAWPVTINTILSRFGTPRYVIPGHDGWTDNTSLQHTLNLLEQYRKK